MTNLPKLTRLPSVEGVFESVSDRRIIKFTVTVCSQLQVVSTTVVRTALTRDTEGQHLYYLPNALRLSADRSMKA